MPFNELRKDYILNRWVVIAVERCRRPTDFVKNKTVRARDGVCPLCPGNEHMTPPAVLLYLNRGGKIEKASDYGDSRPKDWLIRCVPNLYPAFTPPKPEEKPSIIGEVERENLALAVGHHEVLVESPVHDEHPSDARITQLIYVINAYMDRLSELYSRQYVRYVSIFRNHGPEAGASLSHAHSQIIATPMVPRLVAEELEASKEQWRNKGVCAFCEIIENEKNSPRLIAENPDFMALAPYASIHPMEFWIIPKKHRSTMLGLSEAETENLARIMKACLGGLKRLLNDPPYNFGFHMAPQSEAASYYHWHLEVYPKLAIWAGFEKSTGMYINTVSPETAAEHLRGAIQ